MNTHISKKANVAAIVAVTAAIMLASNTTATALNAPLSGETITVTTLNDVSDFSGPQQVSDLPGLDGRVSFREAVTAANNTAGGQTIAFAVPVAEFWLDTSVALLKLEQDAFFLTDSGTTIDFSTQTANIGDTNPNGPEIGIYGLQPNGWGIAAIFVNGDNCVIKGLGKVYQRGYAVEMVGDNNRVIGCQISGPLHSAISIEGYMSGPTPSGNIVGGTQPGEGNTLSGLRIAGPADGNIVIGNTIIGGVDVIGATQYGVIARNNRIGGPTAAERNVISGAGYYGEEGYPVGEQLSIVDADGTIVEGNYIGTTADGMAPYPQQIGPIGVEVRDSRNTTIRGNLIAGLRVVGTNHYAGQIFGQAILVGATNANSQDTVIQGNTIGLAADGVTPIVTRSGIVVSPLSGNYHAFGTLISSNHIASVETTGVIVGSQENGITITGNSIHDCGALGIDLFSGNFGGTGGVTPNDTGDGDTGGNGLQNFPVLLSATTTGSAVTVQGTLDTSASGQFTLEFFASPSCDPSGFGEGAVFLGSTPVTTNSAGHAAFSQTLPASVAVGAKLTATARRVSTGDTSEFSACAPVTSGGTGTPSPSPSPGISPSPSPGISPSPSPGISPSPSPGISPSPSPGISPSPSPGISPSPSPGISPSPSPGISPSPSPGISPSPSPGISPSPSPGISPSPSPGISPSPSPGISPSPSPGISPSPSPGVSPSPSPGISPSPSPSPAAQPVNISTRVRVEAGEGVMIGGFIITGNESKRVIIRGIGPSMTSVGVPGVISDPILRLFGPTGSPIAVNDNWQDTQQAEIEATGIPPQDLSRGGYRRHAAAGGLHRHAGRRQRQQWRRIGRNL